jgi:hypothetical protein
MQSVDFRENPFHEVLTLSPARIAPLLYRRLGRRGSGAQVVLYLRYCIEMQCCPYSRIIIWPTP